MYVYFKRKEETLSSYHLHLLAAVTWWPWHRRRFHIRVLTRRCGGGESGRGGLRRVVMVAAVLVVIGRVGGWLD